MTILDKAAEFKKTTGYSKTTSKLMKKWNCNTFEEYKTLRKKHKKENYIGPRRKPLIPKEKPQQKNFKK